MIETLRFQTEVHFERRGAGAPKAIEKGPTRTIDVPPGRIPRLSRLMAVALRFDGLVRRGEIVSHAELARLGHVTRARISQIMSLLHLAPDIQEELLFLPRIERGRAPLILADVLPIAAEIDWKRQRSLWRRIGPTKESTKNPTET